MKSMLQKFVAVALLAVLAACGGGGKKGQIAVVPQPDYKMTETVTGTGVAAAAGDLVSITYVGYLYDSTKSDGKGAKIESTVDTGSTAPPFIVGVGAARLRGFDQAIVGMRVGSKRTIVLPASLAFGSATRDAVVVNNITYAAITANAPVVYDLELISVTQVSAPVVVAPPATTTFTDVLLGSGDTATTGKTVSVRYSGWLYQGAFADRKGVLFDTNVNRTPDPGPLSFVLDANPLAVIKGMNTGVLGMKVGGKRTIIIPAAEGYGAAGSGTSIPANAALVFDVELITVK